VAQSEVAPGAWADTRTGPRAWCGFPLLEGQGTRPCAQTAEDLVAAGLQDDELVEPWCHGIEEPGCDGDREAHVSDEGAEDGQQSDHPVVHAARAQALVCHDMFPAPPLLDRSPSDEASPGACVKTKVPFAACRPRLWSAGVPIPASLASESVFG